MAEKLIQRIDALCERVRDTERLRAALHVTRAATPASLAIADALDKAISAENSLKNEITIALAEIALAETAKRPERTS